VLIGAAELAMMKPTAYLVNTARAELVNESALYNALREKQIAGAAIDVLSDTASHPLLALDNVIITPHIGAHTTDAITAMSIGAAENLVAALQGRAAPNRVV
jgi:D-3-phosphoglycerate dehydrogenase